MSEFQVKNKLGLLLLAFQIVSSGCAIAGHETSNDSASKAHKSAPQPTTEPAQRSLSQVDQLPAPVKDTIIKSIKDADKVSIKAAVKVKAPASTTEVLAPPPPPPAPAPEVKIVPAVVLEKSEKVEAKIEVAQVTQEKPAAVENTDSGPYSKYSCKFIQEERTLEIIPLENGSGCQLIYTKYNESSEKAKSASEATFCQSVLEKIKANIEAYGFDCTRIK
jgi:hypothetical protein